ncbi:MBL fold metallo-hydrolase [Streptomyces sp. SID1046]|uniref:alkyl/aryl-sulfatase n=1 Tax=Streptomyces TaxID=1883 RepID=UPI001371FF74|nr:alkyl sulfatase dimerization domain-containing protein [Streptomyces sp. SID1046]MYV77580.1 MBL fold metallo-hydrolase [Streptomyces sp. SID1046]
MENGPGHDASGSIGAAHRAASGSGAFADRADFDDATRGFVAALEPCVIKAEDGSVVWDGDAYAFLNGDRPDTVHPSLWRQSRLVALQGLFLVVDGVYQVRGLDLSNMTLVEGDRGVVVIDPLISEETAATALALYRAHRGDRPVTGVLYTHSHADHFGGVKGVTTQAEVDAGRVPVLAPEGFLEHAVSENVYAGTAMARRAGYMYGAGLPKGPRGQVGAGLGQTTSTGRVTLIPPTLDITRTGQEETVDGVRMVFQLTPGTEAPAEFNVLLPDHRALCMAENATHTLHNLLTLRGALVRDPHAWATYLTESIALFGDACDVVFASHHWPTWGRERAMSYLAQQRDLYAYLHDQTVRLLNQGYTGSEIAESLRMPPALEAAWHTHGYYGSVSHNVKAVYQRYMGWFEGNPALLWQHPPVEAARRYVEFMGGAAEVLRRARTSFEQGDFRWVAQVVDHVVFADPSNAEARELQADALEQLGYGAENGTWRNFYLTGAQELRGESVGTPATAASPDVIAALSLDQLVDSLAIRIDGPRAWHADVAVRFVLPGSEPLTLRLANGVLTGVRGDNPAAGRPHAVLVLGEPLLRGLLLGALPPDDLLRHEGVALDGDPAVVAELFAYLDSPDPDFPIVTP